MSETGARQWFDAGAVEESDGVYRIPLPLADPSLRATNVYAIESEQGLTLVDAGWALDEAREALSDGLVSIGRTLADVHDILVTHIHADHYTLAMPIRRLSGATVALGSGERNFLDNAIRQIHPGNFLFPYLEQAGADEVVGKLIADGFGRLLPAGSWELPARWLEGGEAFRISEDRNLRVLATPGHTRGHMVFIDDVAGLTFSGDHILPAITPSIGYETPLADSPLSDYLVSLQLTVDGPDTILLPAHGSPALSTNDRARELLEHHRVRLQASLEAVEDAGSSGLQVARGLRWTRRAKNFEELNPMNQMLAVTETVAHLKVLVERRDLEVVVRGDRHIYRRR